MKNSNIRLEICIDANDPEKLANFWCMALGYERGDYSDEIYLNLVPRQPQKGPVVFLQKVGEKKSTKDRIHLDIYSPEAEKLIKTLLKNGAKLSGYRFHDKDFWWQVMRDPEGNEFCIMPENNQTKPDLPNLI